jgi:hypothetical protein
LSETWWSVPGDPNYENRVVKENEILDSTIEYLWPTTDEVHENKVKRQDAQMAKLLMERLKKGQPLACEYRSYETPSGYDGSHAMRRRVIVEVVELSEEQWASMVERSLGVYGAPAFMEGRSSDDHFKVVREVQKDMMRYLDRLEKVRFGKMGVKTVHALVTMRPFPNGSQEIVGVEIDPGLTTTEGGILYLYGANGHALFMANWSEVISVLCQEQSD